MEVGGVDSQESKNSSGTREGNEDLLSPLSPCIKAHLKKPERSSLTPINDWLGLCKSFMSLLLLPQSLII